MTTIELEETIEIAAPASSVWAVVADYDRDPSWRTGVSTMAPAPAGPVQVGTTTAEVLRLAGSTWRNGGEVVDVTPGCAFRWRTTSGADAEGARHVEPLGPDRCRVRLELRVRPHGVERVLAPVLGRVLRRNLAGDARRLRALAEVGLG